MEVPGYLGYSILGDKSLEFVRSPRDYVRQQRKIYGNVFKGRILNKPHIFLTSNRAVGDFLTSKSSCFSMAYKYYLKELFDGVLVFLEGEEWEDARQLMEGAFSPHSVVHSLDQTRRLIRHFTSVMRTNEPVEIYECFKEMFTRLSIALFLSTNISNESAREISALMTAHWRGIISVPLPISIPFYGWKSGYGRALEAKEKLLEAILEKLQDGSSSNIASELGAAFTDKMVASQHLLLFVSALFPKAAASLLTSAVLELSKSENLSWQRRVQEDDTAAEHVITEVERLWPPFFGGARVCTKSCEVDGYHIPEGAQVAYISYSANRDSKVFPRPDTFSPQRWTNENVADKERVWTFGGGVRKCIGKFLSTTLLKECLQELSRLYTWELLPGQELDYKTLPVSRPKRSIQVVFSKHTDSPPRPST